MKKYTSEKPIFSDEIDILETTDSVHADNINPTYKQLLENTLKNHELLNDLTGNKISKSGDKMTGALSVPTLVLGSTPSDAVGAMWIE